MTKITRAAALSAAMLACACAMPVAHAQGGTDYVNPGGIAGCFNPRLSGRQRAIAERLGGVPCAAAPQQQQAAPPPSRRDARGFPVGFLDGTMRLGTGEVCRSMYFTLQHNLMASSVNRRAWVDTANLAANNGCGADIVWLMLGLAAEGVGQPQTAALYYRRALETSRGGGQAFEVCALIRGDENPCVNVDVPTASAAALQRLSATASTNPPAPRVDAAAASSWVGRYEGQLDGAHGQMEIAAAGDGYRVDLSMGRAGPVDRPGLGCMGEVSGIGRVVGSALSFVTPIPEDSLEFYGNEHCRVDLTRDGPSIRVSENYACTYHHSRSCAFDGSLRRVQPATRPRRTRR